jgi:chemotaxis regulatin CheY-phosphate phosphatase CheZ
MPENASDGSSRFQPPVSARLIADYEAIEATLLASARGRWFLSEFARRNRSSDTQTLLDAIEKLEKAVLNQNRQAQGEQDQQEKNLLAELVEMSEAIAATRREIAAIKPPNQVESQIVTATGELDAVVEATEKATSDILQAAEEIQETAWTMREKGAEPEVCDLLDQRATDIYTACSFQDLTGQRTARVVRVLTFVEQRINAMIDIWGVNDIAFKTDEAAQVQPERIDSHLLNGPQSDGSGLKQDDIDRMLDFTETIEFDAIDVTEITFDAAATAMEAVEAEAAEEVAEAAMATEGEALSVQPADVEPPSAQFNEPAPPPEADQPAAQAQASAAAAPGPQSQSEMLRGKYFEHPEPLTLDRLHAVARAALFG